MLFLSIDKKYIFYSNITKKSCNIKNLIVHFLGACDQNKEINSLIYFADSFDYTFSAI